MLSSRQIEAAVRNGGNDGSPAPHLDEENCPGATHTSNAQNGVFPDALRLLKRMAESKFLVDSRTGMKPRDFKLPKSCKTSPKWTKEEDMFSVIVQRVANRQSEVLKLWNK